MTDLKLPLAWSERIDWMRANGVVHAQWNGRSELVAVTLAPTIPNRTAVALPEGTALTDEQLAAANDALLFGAS